jgi:hypothetical protein
VINPLIPPSRLSYFKSTFKAAFYRLYDRFEFVPPACCSAISSEMLLRRASSTICSATQPKSAPKIVNTISDAIALLIAEFHPAFAPAAWNNLAVNANSPNTAAKRRAIGTDLDKPPIQFS